MAEVIMKINGRDMSDYFRLTSLRGRTLPGRSVELLDIAGRDGGVLDSFRYNPREIEAEILVSQDDIGSVIRMIKSLPNELNGRELNTFEFSDEEGLEYYGIVSDITEGDIINGNQRINLTILCPDPIKYGPEKVAEFNGDSVNFTNNGTSVTKPIFELEATKPVTFASISTGDRSMMIGRPVNLDEIAEEQFTTILRNTMQSTVGWTGGINVESNRIVTGEMKSNGEYFYADSFGTGVEGQYHGPALRTSLSESLTDFRAEAVVRFSNSVGEVGRLEFSLLDANNNQVCRFSLYDNSPSRNYTRFSARAGDHVQGQLITDTEADYWQNWKDFFGLIRIQRIGNKWTAYATLIDPTTWRYHTAHLSPTITTNYGGAQVSQIQIHMMTYTASWGTYEPVYMRVEDLYVRRINDISGIPYIAGEGDIITFDHRNSVILINGEPRKDLKQFGAEYFEIPSGNVPLVVLPEDSFRTTIKYREGYL